MLYRWSLALSLALILLAGTTTAILAQADATGTPLAPLQATVTALMRTLESDQVCAATTSQLRIGVLARVQPGIAVDLLVSSDLNSDVLAQIVGGEQVVVTGGPVCIDDVIFWTVVYAGRSGWVAEEPESNAFVDLATPVATGRPSSETRGMVLLPNTGETPWWRTWAVAVVVGMVTAGLSWLLIKLGRRVRSIVAHQ